MCRFTPCALAGRFSRTNTTKLRHLVLLLLILAVCLVAALPVAVLADFFPAWVGLLVLVGVLVPGLLLGLLAARSLVGKRRPEFAARLQERQGIFTWACAVATVGGLVASEEPWLTEISK